ncbi:hypothetical protein [Flammeovirga sp. EKP202]|uniref:hypothetical protein n=1 Tax=Flammeovirga sp. EKP202 TaxID=2770592 RepID=UPI00165F68A0|nr:hypothetical protein [Flammeovirga sp. EKP202]MBD0404979.1 hypothetical protein [Flammeovirga sp. EKP202]
MNSLKYILLTCFILCNITKVIGQNHQNDFTKTLHHYYLEKDEKLLEHSIEFFNSNKFNSEQLTPMITGFYGGLFLKDAEVKEEFKIGFQKFEDPLLRKLFKQLLKAEDIDELMNGFPISPSQNDMNWAAFFSTGNTKYLTVILKNATHAENREDLNLFLTGASAKWSLASNAQNHKRVSNFLKKNKEYKDLSKDILEKEPADFKKQIREVIIQERAKGNWL